MLRSATRVKEAGFDLTPMIDIVMLLIVFFVLTMRFQAEERMLELPEVMGEHDKERARNTIIIDLESNGRLSEAGRTVDVEELIKKVMGDGTQRQREVVLRADRRCSVKQINVLAGALARAGVNSWRLATSGGSAGGGGS
jgi:biopolymer transport protein ExbD